MDNEEELLENEGEDRILSNIALGYLENGVTVAKMADAYQVFANEGVDTSLCAVKEIKNQTRRIGRRGRKRQKCSARRRRIL